ncbi:MAG: fasciclin domain-containing protein [Prevotella sp.]|nr:fasciclin domain-containing protein [Candidatus Prevotella equi]
MLQTRTFKTKGKHWLCVGAMLLVSGMGLNSCDKYDLDKNLPDGWGQSIYSYMAEHDFKYMTRIVDDLGYADVLGKTGSKTLFAANDEAFERFFKNGNAWNVKSYDQLTLAQKKMILFGAMVDNSFQAQSLSNAESSTSDGDPKEGVSMRRATSLDVFDTISVLKKEQMPDNPYWARYRDRGSIVCWTDRTNSPMLQFIQKQMDYTGITDDDYRFLFNKTVQRETGDVSINGSKVVEQNIRCSNGFIHRVEDVVTSLPNIAEVIRSKSFENEGNPYGSTKIFNRLMERFCAPYKFTESNTGLVNQYNYLNGTSIDSIYEKRFFAERTHNDQITSDAKILETPDGGPIDAWLKFDPEWNSYFFSKSYSPTESMMRDMGVIMVPSDDAMTRYWNNEGAMLRDNYGTWDNVPNDVIVKLINNNMFPSFLASVPSKFKNILNDANDPMGLVPEAIDSVWLGCNGAVYLTNRVYTPTSYVSVSYPALINQTMKIINWAIEECKYDVYLNSLNSKYSFFIPTNGAMLEYVDPVSYGKTKTQMFRFFYDPSKTEKSERVWASIWECEIMPDGSVVRGDSIGLASTGGWGQVKNRLKDILETHIVIGEIDNEHHYYRTKDGMALYVNNVEAGENGMTVSGSYQMNEGQPIPVTKIYDQSKKGNGKAYILDGQPIMGTRKTVASILNEVPEFSEFAKLLSAAGLTETFHRIGDTGYSCGGENIKTFNKYHYTIYVPTNESLEALEDEGKLPKPEDVAYDPSILETMDDAAKANFLAQVTADSTKIAEFVKYHIQDNALFINSKFSDAEYETSVINTATKQFRRLSVKYDGGLNMTVKGEGNVNACKVLTSNPSLYNLQAREYICEGGGVNPQNATQISTASSAVIHYIDGPLLIKK